MVDAAAHHVYEEQRAARYLAMLVGAAAAAVEKAGVRIAAAATVCRGAATALRSSTAPSAAWFS